MTPSNLPPGVTESMLPGSRPEDEWAEEVWNNIEEDIITACDLDRNFDNLVQDDINTYSPLDDDPIYVAQQVSERHFEQAIVILEEE